MLVEIFQPETKWLRKIGRKCSKRYTLQDLSLAFWRFFRYSITCNRQYQPSGAVCCVGRRWKSDERGKVTWVLFRLVLASLPIFSVSAAKIRRRRSLMRSPMRCRTGSPCKNSIGKSRSFGSGIFLSEKRMLPACPTQPAASKRTENGCSRRWYEKMTNGCEFQLNVTFFVICPLRFACFFGYYGLVTGNINHPVSPNVCGGIGNLTKGLNGLRCMALWN